MKEEDVKRGPDPDISKLSDLNQSFLSFNGLIEKLNASYKSLEKRFESLNKQLEETNYKLRRALIENQKAQDFLEKLTESVPSGIVVYDLDGSITMMNRAACELLKIDQRTAMLHGLKFASDSNPEYSAVRTMQTQSPAISEEKLITLKTGEKLTVSLSTALLYDEYDKISGALELYHDISKIRRLEDEITRVKTLAALGEMAATVAHEVRNPLGGILGFAALLRKDFSDDDPRIKTVDKIIKGVENLDKSVSSLLNYAQEVHPAVKAVRIKPFVEEVVTNFRMTLEQNGEASNIDLIISPESLEWQFDPQHISQCLTNLLLNAHQAQEGNSEIKLSVVADDKLSIVISDPGSGISRENKKKLFTPFFTTRNSGTGLGLATVKKLVLLHKGEVKVDSEIGRGTDITLEIPANLH
ncbi:MAG: PAS domain S-box protein [candidate division Zixibacteria bacterium]|nr:PAS domain S-box protein [candidate division Zixibacteria bacterium]NIR63594.1 PAS domain S-box protein [candidate division Zixibacteria bacterium]NIS15177.1 PAS domain S-box protein [candidate division Zixibacteria bacterium]NIS45562.1 PAS domain S-box protein [candidate division Zixibacteria bacterium]NIT51675.1 PAS domain S-box protein [candidate division Zixibacteria bacterium]